jgi:hypothetical protein
MRKQDLPEIIFVCVMIILVYTLFCTTLIMASPYQLNLTTGILTDLNSSNNETANLTIYIIHIWSNYTINTTYIQNNYTYVNSTIYQNITNITNITWQNITCINCSYIYSNETTYNKTEADSRFVLTTEENSYRAGINLGNYIPRGEFDTLTNKVNSINSTGTIETKTSGWLWGLSIGGLVIGLLAFALAWKVANG